MRAASCEQTRLRELHVAGLPMGLLISPVERGLLDLFRHDEALAKLLCITSESHALNIDAAVDIANDTAIGHTHPSQHTAALQKGFAHLALALRQQGLVPGWRNECFSVRKPDGSVWFALERSCFRPLGLISHAVHAHAWCENGDTWLGRRAQHKATDPGLLDNLAAGGLSHGEEPFECMVRELWEEAGVPETLARQIQALPATILSERCEAEGMHREWLHCYTLNLPDSFTPANRDGEVSGFTRCNISELQALTASDAMTRDAALCANLALRCRLAA